MTGFNLPPGVEVHHIPGNRPEDVAEDKFFEHVDKMLAESIGESRADHFFDHIGKGDFEEVLREYASIAAGLASATALIEEEVRKERLTIKSDGRTHMADPGIPSTNLKRYENETD
jgi:hypothetical protein